MKNLKTKFIALGLIFISIAFVSCAQSREDKTKAIIKKLNLIENQKTMYKFQIEPLKNQTSGYDSIRIEKLEEKLSDDEIEKRICSAFIEIFDDNDINNIYDFINTTAFDKFFNSKETYSVISSKFQDIETEIKDITSNISNQSGVIDELKKEKFTPKSIDRENGFYETIDYSHSTTNENIKLKEKPSLTFDMIKEVKKTYQNYGGNDKPTIVITLTKEGAKIFYLLTKENIGKPIAIVIDKQIVSMPTVNGEIMGGIVLISGDFTENEADKMIKELKKE